jgi:hypothetical protein
MERCVCGYDEQPLEQKFDVTKRVLDSIFFFVSTSPVQICFSSSQQKAFIAYFEQTQLQYLNCAE